MIPKVMYNVYNVEQTDTTKRISHVINVLLRPVGQYLGYVMTWEICSRWCRFIPYLACFVCLI